MAFLQHAPRRRTEQEIITDAADNDKALSVSVNAGASRHGPSKDRRRQNGSPHSGDRLADHAAADWSLVFPGRARRTDSGGSGSGSNVDSNEQLATPFRDPNDLDDEATLQLALPVLHDGTGRFTRPSSPSYAGDDELDPLGTADLSPTSPMVPISGGALSDSFIFGNSDDDELDLNDAELATSALFTESELGGAAAGSGAGDYEGGNGGLTAARLRRTQRDSSHALVNSSSWAFMQQQGSAASSNVRSRRNPLESWAVLPPAAVLTSDSEGEDEFQDGRVGRSGRRTTARHPRRTKDDLAYEEAIETAHQAQSAGIYARIPKRRHRKNGESEKGSKRSNTSEMRSQQARRGQHARRSQTSAASAAARSRSRLGVSPPEENRHDSTPIPRTQQSKGERLLNVILTRIFGVDDEEILQAFLRDEGRLQITPDENQRGVAAAISSRTPLGRLNNGEDDIWTRNQRQRHLRRLLEGDEEEQGVESEADEENEEDDGLHVTHTLGRARRYGGGRSATNDRYPRRSYVPGNVAEPSLAEALHATVLSGLRVVPSGLSILLAGSTSVRFVNYLVGRMGPNFSDRMRKLVDSVGDEDEETQEDSRSTVVADAATVKSRSMRSNSTAAVSDNSSVRFAGSAHPAIAAAAAASSSSGSQRSTVIVPASSM